MKTFKPVKLYKHGDRGFHRIGTPFKDSYGGDIKVIESSAASAPHVWVNFVPGPGFPERPDVSMHLNKRQVRALIARLETWLVGEETTAEACERGVVTIERERCIKIVKTLSYCACDECWTIRSMHAPDCAAEIGADIAHAIREGK